MNTAHRRWRAPILLGAVLLGGAQAAQAQAVYKCMVDGHLVYQSSLCRPPEARTSVAAAPVAVAATPPAAAAPKKKTLAELLRERDGATPTSPATREPQGDGANILRSRMGAV
jgi:hypothetical protein